jgi:citrate synthase
MSDNAKLIYGDQSIDLPVITGTEGEKGINVKALRDKTGLVTFDDGYGNTGSCESKVTFIDGEKGILRYRGIPIEDLAEKSTFLEASYLLIWGKLPTEQALNRFRSSINENSMLHEGMRHHFEGFPPGSHPMAILTSMISSLSCFYPHLHDLEDDASFEEAVCRLMGQTRAIAAYAYKSSIGEPFVYPRPDVRFAPNFLHMMFTRPYRDFIAEPEIADALDMIFLLHADHEQNCSTSTVRMVGSAKTNLFASISAGICALWGSLHGGANQEVLAMLEEIHSSGQSVQSVIARAKQKDSGFRLFGFGHRVYKNFDPRAKIIKTACDRVLAKIGKKDPLLDIAKELEEAALADPYFVERKLYPNVDFYSGIIMRAIGIPLNMFTVLFAIGRMPGWIAHWYELRQTGSGRIYRPRQIYQGSTVRTYEEAREADAGN